MDGDQGENRSFLTTKTNSTNWSQLKRYSTCICDLTITEREEGREGGGGGGERERGREKGQEKREERSSMFLTADRESSTHTSSSTEEAGHAAAQTGSEDAKRQRAEQEI